MPFRGPFLNEKLLNKRVAISGVCVFLLLFACLVAVYVRTFEGQLREENNTRLSEVSAFAVTHMTRAVNDTLAMLQAAVVTLERLEAETERLKALEELAERFGFAYAGYADPTGHFRTTMPLASEDIGEEIWFHRAVTGTPSVSGQIRRILTNRAVSGVFLAVPMTLPEGMGAAVALLPTKSLKEALNHHSFGGAAYSCVIDRRGNLVMNTRALDLGNLFRAWEGLMFHEGYSLRAFEAAVAAGRDGMTRFMDPARRSHYVYHSAIPFNDWTLLTLVDEDAVSAKTISLTRELAFFVGGLVAAFMALVVWGLRASSLSRESRLAAEAKSAFLANMSHEIRTPMNAIVGLSEIMLRDTPSPVQREQLTRILNSGKGLLTIINDILDVSKIEAGKFTIANEPYLLESLLYDVTLVAVIRIGEKPVEFFVDPEPGLPGWLVGDLGRVKQVLLNIINNAVKFTERGSICLGIQGEQDERGWVIRFTVRDTGFGIKKDDLSKLFVRFNQVDTKRTRQAEGTGLGLTISVKLCELMEGGISVESDYGKGSVFTITVRQGVADDPALLVCQVEREVSLLVYESSALLARFERDSLIRLGLPHELCANQEVFMERAASGSFTHLLAPGDVLRALPPPLPQADGTVCQPTFMTLLPLCDHISITSDDQRLYTPLFALHLPYLLNGRAHELSAAHITVDDTTALESLPYVSVLIVDDNELNVLVAEGVMAPLGLRTGQALSGLEAIEEVQKNDYDLVLMDHMMPEMDGIETAHRIRALPGWRFARLPIVALTANATTEAQQLFMKNGFNEFLTKPIEPAKLYATLRHFLRPLNARRAAELARQTSGTDDIDDIDTVN